MKLGESEHFLLDCEVCMKEIPVSEDKSEEARDYILHYYGVDCYDTWRRSGDALS